MATFTLCCCVIALPILVLGYGQEWKYDERPASTASITEQKIEKSERGWIGCMYNRKVCEDGERCIDDGLFGVCRSRRAGISPSMLLFNYRRLDSDWRRILETELALLAVDGYKWTDVYTQCILRSTLLAYRSGSLRDAAVCVDAGTRANEAATPLEEVEAATRARKRDAALTLHKYFDRGQPVKEEEEEWIDADDVARMRRQLAVLDRLQQRARSTLDTDDVRDLPQQQKGNDDLSLVEALVRNKVGSQQRKRAGGMGHANMKSSARNMDTGRALRQLRPSKRRAAHSDVGNAAHARQAAEAELEEATRRPRTVVDSRWVFLSLGWPAAAARRGFGSAAEVRRFLDAVEKAVGLPPKLYDDFELSDGEVDFHLPPHLQRRPQAVVARLDNVTRPLPGGPVILGSGFGRAQHKVAAARLAPRPKHFGVTFAVCGGVLFIIAAAILLFLLQRHRLSRSKLGSLTQQAEQGESRDAYQELCRQRMAARSADKPEPLSAAARAVGPALSRHDSNSAGSTRSSTSSWSEEPIHSNMDISTGHLILSYMEEHLNNKEKLESEWNNLCAYQPDVVKCDVGKREENLSRNRYLDNIPYDNSRVELKTAFEGSTYFNASYVINHDPKNPVYIVTQGPLANTTAQFWQMVWEQGSIVIVNLTRLVEDGISLCQKYWPEEGSELYNNYEVHLVSEHVWCEDYLVRSFYLKNVTTGETRTVTQFHFLSWPDLGEPSTVKTLLDFRRKVNKSYKGRSCPVVVHCSDGCGRSGTYILLDMVLNRLAKGVKEIDISAAVEHLRDQRCQMVKTRGQFEFVLTAIAEEVHAMLKSLPQ